MRRIDIIHSLKSVCRYVLFVDKEFIKYSLESKTCLEICEATYAMTGAIDFLLCLHETLLWLLSTVYLISHPAPIQ